MLWHNFHIARSQHQLPTSLFYPLSLQPSKSHVLTIKSKGGLTAILGSATSPSQIQSLTLRARCFYYSRKHSIPVDFEAYKTHCLKNDPNSAENLPNPSVYPTASAASTVPKSEDNPPYPTSFAEVVALITTGAPIPGIKEIPPTVLSEQATKPSVNKRRKPWERDDAMPLVREGEGTFGDRRDEVIVQQLPE
jgi:hypothetical protein